MTKTLRPNVRRINSERCFTECGRVTQHPGAPRGGRQGGHFPPKAAFQEAWTRASQPQFESNLSPRRYGKKSQLLDFSGSTCFLCKYEQCPPAPTGWLWGPKAFDQYLTYPNEQKKYLFMLSTPPKIVTVPKLKSQSSVQERTNTLLQFPLLLLPCFGCQSPHLVNTLCGLSLFLEKEVSQEEKWFRFSLPAYAQ